MSHKQQLLSKFKPFLQQKIYPALSNHLSKLNQTSNLNSNALLSHYESNIKRCIDYNTCNGKQIRAKLLLNTFSEIQAVDFQSKTSPCEDLVLSCAWAIEFLQAGFLVADDIMDSSEKRRGQTCWYKLPKVGQAAINDAFLLESFTLRLPRLFAEQFDLDRVLETFTDVLEITKYGQALDMDSENLGLEDFTEERYDAIVTYKTSYWNEMQ